MPLIALMIVVLVAMVGLAVDVGNTYAEQRNTQRATNAAALAGMGNLIRGGDDNSVYSVIKSSLTSNNIHVAAGAHAESGERVVDANYLDASGNPLTACPNVGSNCTATQLQGAKYIRVNVSGKVDTFFARVVGRPDLPVAADSWVSRGPCVSGVYPILVRDTLLGANGFTNSESSYSDADYRNKTVKTIYIHDAVNNPSGGFNWTRWNANNGDQVSGGTAAATEAMMTGPGNIAKGFDEAAWPASNSLNLPKPTGYPLKPGQLTPGDWLYANTGVGNSSGLQAQLAYHMNHKTVLILPIWDAEVGSGSGATFHASRLGGFLLLGYNLSGATSGPNAGYIKLAYVGDSTECPVPVEPPTCSGTCTRGILGDVQYRPRNREVPQSRPPVQYEIVLDVSGSMTWNFAGYGKSNGQSSGSNVLCTGANAGCSGVANAWWPVDQRRIYIAKNAIKSFIDQMAANDSMQLVSFSGGPFSPGSNSKAINDLTDIYPTTGWSSDKAVLKKAVDDAGKMNGNPYLTEGRTPSAVGLARGTQVFNSAPTKEPVSKEIYKRVVIFLTDGVANVKRDGAGTAYNTSIGCGSEVASCNVGYETNGDAKPITAMGIEASTLKQGDKTLYVIALAGVDATGLKNVASAPNAPFYSTSTTGSDLQQIFDDIAEDVKYGDCIPDGGNVFEKTMKEEQVGVVPTDPLSFPVVGYATLKTSNGGTLPNGKVQIRVDTNTGKLMYAYNDLAPGTYQLTAFVGFKGEDNISRIYSQIFNPATETTDTALTINVDPSTALGTIIPQKTVYLDMAGSVCP
jgi:hypothetical protein